MRRNLGTCVAASFALLFGTAAASGPICPPMPDCEAAYVECAESTGDPDFCWRTIMEPCIADMCSVGPGGPGIPPV